MITKIFIDSRHSIGKANDFTITLPESLSFPKRTIARVAEACIPNSWFLVDEGNDGLYVIKQDTNGENQIHKATLAHQHMNATEFAQAMASALEGIIGPNVAATYQEETNTLLITAPVAFTIPSDEQLETFAATGLIEANFRSCNGILEHLNGDRNVSLADTTGLSAQWTSPGLDINRYHSVFIHSSLADNQTIDCSMRRTNCLKKVMITAPPKSKVFDSLSTSHDYCDVSEMNVRTISFSLRDRVGNLINLQDHSWSLSIVFDYS